MSQQTAGVAWPVTDGTRVPFEIYTSQDVFEREQERIFRGPLWNYVALEAEIPDAGRLQDLLRGRHAGRGEPSPGWRGACVREPVRASGGDGAAACLGQHQGASVRLSPMVLQQPRRSDQRAVPAGDDRVWRLCAGFRYESARIAKIARGVAQGRDFRDIRSVGAEPGGFPRGAVAGCDRSAVLPRGESAWPYAAAHPWQLETLCREHARSVSRGVCCTGSMRRSAPIAAIRKGFRGHDRARAHSAGGKYGDDFAKPATAETVGDDNYIAGYSLTDPSLMAGRPDFNDNINLAITSIFPSVVVQQIMNTLATRHIRPKAPDDFELYWTYFGYADDDAETTAARLKQANLVGPAGLISMEDGEAVELIQRAIVRDGKDCAFLEFGPVNADPEQDTQGEDAVRAFWRYYQGIMA